MRKLPYITVGLILEELKNEGMPITRPTFYRLEERIGFRLINQEEASSILDPIFIIQTTSGNKKWRVYSRPQADLIKKKIKAEYNFVQ